MTKLASTPPSAAAIGPVKESVAFDSTPTVLPTSQASTAAGFHPPWYQYRPPVPRSLKTCRSG